jgi:hypothetical protein
MLTGWGQRACHLALLITASNQTECVSVFCLSLGLVA